MYTWQAVSPYAPAVIKELLNEVIETGHGQQVRHNIARHFFSSAAPRRLTKATVSPPLGDAQQDAKRQRLLADDQSDEARAIRTAAAVACPQQVTAPARQGDIPCLGLCIKSGKTWRK